MNLHIQNESTREASTQRKKKIIKEIIVENLSNLMGNSLHTQESQLILSKVNTEIPRGIMVKC